jgi:hypothetical protein
MASRSDNSENLPRPGAIGRVARLFFGVIFLFFFAQLLRQAPGFLAAPKGWHIPGGDWWVVAIGCFLALSGVVNDGFGRKWRRWPQWIYFALVVAAVGLDLIVYKVPWAPPLAFLALLLILYVLGHSGISFLIAAAAAAPG